MGRHDQQIAGADGPPGLAAGLPVQPDTPTLDTVRSQTARLEQARMEQPFVQPQGR